MRNDNTNTATLAQCRDYLQIGFNLPRAGGHVPQAVSCAIGSSEIEAAAIVVNLQTDAGTDWVKRNGDIGGMSVAQTVAHRLLGDMEKLGGLGGGQAVGRDWIHLNLKLRRAVAAGQRQ